MSSSVCRACVCSFMRDGEVLKHVHGVLIVESIYGRQHPDNSNPQGLCCTRHSTSTTAFTSREHKESKREARASFVVKVLITTPRPRMRTGVCACDNNAAAGATASRHTTHRWRCDQSEANCAKCTQEHYYGVRISCVRVVCTICARRNRSSCRRAKHM